MEDKITHRDILGQVLEIGDYIAIASNYSTSTLRLDVGVITGFDSTGNSVYYYPCRLIENDGTVYSPYAGSPAKGMRQIEERKLDPGEWVAKKNNNRGTKAMLAKVVRVKDPLLAKFEMLNL